MTDVTIASIRAMVRQRKALRYPPVREVRVTRRQWRALENELKWLNRDPAYQRLDSINLFGVEILLRESAHGRSNG